MSDTPDGAALLYDAEVILRVVERELRELHAVKSDGQEREHDAGTDAPVMRAAMVQAPPPHAPTRR